MKPLYLLVLLCASHIGWARAEIYKHTDPEGHVTYSSSPMKGARKLDLAPPPSASAPPVQPRGEAARTDFPKVDNATQKSRDSARHKILSDELAAEEKLLAEARKSLRDAGENPAALSGKARPGAAINDEKIKTLQELVSLHEKNVGALKVELSGRK
ncbi:MAG: DUF4124 domain-containing protein [Nitrosomonadales bacterium]|nr:DUF4124 domain-containing protein [Nitrosomonadales bacterium]